jgi:hypothetical protein
MRLSDKYLGVLLPGGRESVCWVSERLSARYLGVLLPDFNEAVC